MDHTDAVKPENEDRTDRRSRSWTFRGIDCPSCALAVEQRLNREAGVESAHLDYARKKITITAREEQPSPYFENLITIAKRVEPLFKVVGPKTRQKEIPFELIRILLSAIFFSIALLTRRDWAYVISYLVAGYSVIWRAIRNILGGKIFDEHFLMSVASIGALAIGEVGEAAAVMLLYIIGEYLQDAAVRKSRTSILATLDLKTEETRVVDGERVTLVPSESVPVGTTVRVLAGEKIPLDGVVVGGTSALDMKSLTGESLPVPVEEGSVVLSSSVNLSGSLEIRTTKVWKESTAARILHLVEESAAKKAPPERFITTFARYYTPAVVGLALLLFLIPLIATGATRPWLYRALVFLVVSCPCALVISVPLSYFAGIGKSAKSGIIVKGGNYLEALAKAKCAIFDKTGTLTTGTFTIDSIDLFDARYPKERVALLAASLERRSTHPLARAFEAFAHIEEVTDIREHAGKGIVGTVGEERIAIGNNALHETLDNPMDEQGALLMSIDGTLVARFNVTDTIKDEAPALMKRLRSFGITTIGMITGDGLRSAEAVGTALGLDEVHPGLLPHRKQETMLAMGKRFPDYFYVGDGMNDAPSLAASKVGIAIGSGASDAAIEHADAVIIGDDLTEVGNLVAIGRKTARIVRQNIVLALGVKALAMIFAASGHAPMWVAVIADSGVTFLAVLNALRLFIFNPSR
ncbi:MAG: cadmium-translocating P-type ATPase [Spirochaetales bacterium]|nr:cadmium-translocating P-type ATPase [Spirochaetales bacterium]